MDGILTHRARPARLWLRRRYMAAIEGIDIDLTVVIGTATMPLGRLLSLGRGAVIPLGGDGSTPLTLVANGLAVAEGRVLLDGETISVEVAPAKASEESTSVDSTSDDFACD